MVDYNTAFRKPFTDIKKLVIGILLSIFPIVNWFAVGFIIECSGLGKYKPSKKMPEWKKFSDYFFKGFVVAVINVLYMLPGIIVLVMGALFSVSAAAMGIILTGVMSASWETLLPFILAMIPFVVVSFLLFALASYIAPAASLTFLKNRRFSAAFNLNVVFKKAFSVQYFLAILAWFIVATIGFMITKGIPFLGGAIMFFITGVIGYSLLGEAYKEAK